MQVSCTFRALAAGCNFAVLTVLAAAGNAATIHVPGDYDTIQQAVNGSDHDDTIIVADGEYSGPGFHEIHLRGKRITVRSANGPENCILNCQDAYRGFYLYENETSDSRIEGFTVKNGSGTYGGGFRVSQCDPTIVNCIVVDCRASEKGGGLFCFGGDPIITDCTFAENWATRFGGGLYFDGSNPVITGCTLEHNYSEMYPGGGVHCTNGSEVTIADTNIMNNYTPHFGGGVYSSLSDVTMTGCKISGNKSSDVDGGGIYCTEGDLTLTDCEITGNYAYDGGGGVYCVESEVKIAGCMIGGNTANGDNGGGGGGISCRDCQLELTRSAIAGNKAWGGAGGGLDGLRTSMMVVNCLFAENMTIDRGGGICVEYYNVLIADCTIVNNTADSGGGLSSAETFPMVVNSVLWGNAPEQICGEPTVRYCDLQGGWEGPGEHVTDDDPMFVDPDGPDNDPETWEDNDYRLSAGSPCIDAGDNTAVPDGVTTDLDGNPRFYDDPDTPDTGFGEPPIVDLGPYEAQLPSCPADVNNDGKVNIDDLFIVLGLWGPCNDPDDCPADVNFDGVVDIEDIFAILGAWGPCP